MNKQIEILTVLCEDLAVIDHVKIRESGLWWAVGGRVLVAEVHLRDGTTRAITIGESRAFIQGPDKDTIWSLDYLMEKTDYSVLFE